MAVFSLRLFWPTSGDAELAPQSMPMAQQRSLSIAHAIPVTKPKEALSAQSFTGNPGHWRAIDIDGELIFDAAGNLVVSRSLRRLFDHFLSTIGDVELAQIQQQLLRYIIANAPTAAADQGQQLLQTYLDYKTRLQELTEQQQYLGQQPQQIKRRIELKQSLRRHFFEHEVVQAFFSVEESAENLLMQQWAIQQDASLSLQQQADALAAIARPASKEQALLQLLRDRRANLEPVQFDEAAEQRLAQLGRKRLQWQGRLQQYRLQRVGLSTDDDSALLALREQYFSAVEIKRVAALDLVAQQQQAAKDFAVPAQNIDPEGFNQRLVHYQSEKQQLQISQQPDGDLAPLRALIDAHFPAPNETSLVQKLEGLNE